MEVSSSPNKILSDLQQAFPHTLANSHAKPSFKQASFAQVKDVFALYERDPIPGLEISDVEVIENPAQRNLFEQGLSILDQGIPKTTLESYWRKSATKENEQLKELILKTAKVKSETFSTLGRSASVIPMFYPEEYELFDITTRIGLIPGCTVESKLFKGAPALSSSARHISKYFSNKFPDRKGLFYTFVSYASLFPLASEDVQGKLNLRKVSRFDASYSLVRSSEDGIYPIEPGDVPFADEIGVYQKHQVLLKYKVSLALSPIRIKQLSHSKELFFEHVNEQAIQRSKEIFEQINHWNLSFALESLFELYLDIRNHRFIKKTRCTPKELSISSNQVRGMNLELFCELIDQYCELEEWLDQNCQKKEIDRIDLFKIYQRQREIDEELISALLSNSEGYSYITKQPSLSERHQLLPGQLEISVQGETLIWKASGPVEFSQESLLSFGAKHAFLTTTLSIDIISTNIFPYLEPLSLIALKSTSHAWNNYLEYDAWKEICKIESLVFDEIASSPFTLYKRGRLIPNHFFVGKDEPFIKSRNGHIVPGGSISLAIGSLSKELVAKEEIEELIERGERPDHKLELPLSEVSEEGDLQIFLTDKYSNDLSFLHKMKSLGLKAYPIDYMKRFGQNLEIQRDFVMMYHVPKSRIKSFLLNRLELNLKIYSELISVHQQSKIDSENQHVFQNQNPIQLSDQYKG